MDEQQYKEAKQELKKLQSIDWENDQAACDSAEQIAYRMQCLQADIFAYEHTGIAYNPYEQGLG